MSVTLRQFANWLTESGLMTADAVSSFLESLPPEKEPQDGAQFAKAQ
jgi:hypothetical protein